METVVEKPEGERQLGRDKFRWDDIIKIYHKERGCEVVGWNHLPQDRFLLNWMMIFVFQFPEWLSNS
jgi:hypothetical protein